jgi:hypothetical protein
MSVECSSAIVWVLGGGPAKAVCRILLIPAQNLLLDIRAKKSCVGDFHQTPTGSPSEWGMTFSKMSLPRRSFR